MSRNNGGFNWDLPPGVTDEMIENRGRVYRRRDTSVYRSKFDHAYRIKKDEAPWTIGRELLLNKAIEIAKQHLGAPGLRVEHSEGIFMPTTIIDWRPE